uniref:WAP domain-containing protein n=1 Tax=Romanomermis culicivorax TaxID=13658 RepID=A0A915IKY6_ROMCU
MELRQPKNKRKCSIFTPTTMKDSSVSNCTRIIQETTSLKDWSVYIDVEQKIKQDNSLWYGATISDGATPELKTESETDTHGENFSGSGQKPKIDQTLDHENICKQPIQSGICMAYFPRYGYNSTTCPIPSLSKPKQGCRYNEEPDDRDCPKYEIVCDVKPGLCPTDHESAHIPNACSFQCSHSDDRCPGEEKCCKIGCNVICVPPVPAN